MKSKVIPLSLFGDELLTEKETEEKGKTTERPPKDLSGWTFTVNQGERYYRSAD